MKLHPTSIVAELFLRPWFACSVCFLHNILVWDVRNRSCSLISILEVYSLRLISRHISRQHLLHALLVRQEHIQVHMVRWRLRHSSSQILNPHFNNAQLCIGFNSVQYSLRWKRSHRFIGITLNSTQHSEFHPNYSEPPPFTWSLMGTHVDAKDWIHCAPQPGITVCTLCASGTFSSSAGTLVNSIQQNPFKQTEKNYYQQGWTNISTQKIN